jgi:hypothetical protein
LTTDLFACKNDLARSRRRQQVEDEVMDLHRGAC